MHRGYRGEVELKRRWILALLASASFIAVVDTTIVSIALPSMRQSLGFSTAGSQWVLNAYALVFGGLLLADRMADLYGRRRLFALGLAVFGCGIRCRAAARKLSCPRPSHS